MADTGMVVGLIKALGGTPDPAVITEAVNDWLDDHPEATTTVEDGSITNAKLDASLQETVADVGDLKTAIDDLSTATSLDVGKALSPKTVTNGKVTEWQYKAIGGGGGGAVEDVQVNGVSVVDGGGVANIPQASDSAFGVVKVKSQNGISQNASNELTINPANINIIKPGTATTYPITVSHQHESAFYGLAKAAGADLKDVSDVTVGTYPDTAKAAIQNMLGVANKANIDGSYPDMTVGNTEQLVATVGVEDSVPYNFRTAGGSADIGDREVDKVVGGTVAWNQLFTYKSDYDAGVTTNEVTVKRNADGSFTATGTATATTRFQFDNNRAGLTIAGHKYFIGNIAGGSASTYYLMTSDNGSFGISALDTGIYNETGGTGGISCNQFSFRVIEGATLNLTFTPQIFDLTQMFGSTIADYIYSLEQATAGAGVAWFRKLFPKPYYAYNAGELMHVKTSAHKMVGFNQWDEEWEVGTINSTGESQSDNTRIRSKNYTPIVPNTVYYFKDPTSDNNARIYFYDADKSFLIMSNWTIGAFTTPSNAHYLRFIMASSYGTTYHNDICINLSWDGERDGEYEPYQAWEYPLDSDLVLRGIPKLDADNNLYYDGDTYESDGTVTRRYGIVDLGTLTWMTPTTNIFRTNDLASVIKHSPNQSAELLCGKYTTILTSNWASGTDKIITSYPSYSNGNILVVDTGYSDAATFKAAMSGVYLVYELAESTTETAAPYQNPQIVEDFGTEEYVDTRDVAIPVGHDTTYRANLRAKLEMSPNSPDGDGDYIVRQANGMNEYVLLTKELPAAPTSDGNYILKCTVASGTATYTWEAQT